MSFFDKLRGASTSDMTPRAAMLLACISMVGADGDIDDDEIAIINRIDGKQVTPAWDQAVRVWKQVSNPRDCVALTAPKLDEAQRRFTLANLVDIAMADGVLGGAEQQLLQDYLQAFGLDDGFVNSLAEFVSIKNDRSPFTV
jgi:uncharacterized tellurite resistance protein B-like protein